MIKIAAFCCNWCSYAGADLCGSSRLKYPADVRIIRVPCSSRVDASLVLRAFQKGADGVMINGCHPGDCHYVSGNFHTRRRMALLKNLLKFMGLEEERLEVNWISGSEAQKFQQTVSDFTEKIHKLGESEEMRDLRCQKPS